MPDDPSVIEMIGAHLRSAREQKHRQRYYAAIKSFLEAERLIIELLPPEQRSGANAPEGPPRVRIALLARALFERGAGLAIAGGSLALMAEAHLTSSNQPRSVLEVMLEERGEHPLGAVAAGSDNGAPASSLALLTRRISDHYDARRETASPSTFAERIEPRAVPFQFAHFYFADIPLGIGDCLIELGQEFDRALAYYSRVERYPFTNAPYETQDLWLRLAEAHLARGDAAFRAFDIDAARADYQQILERGDIPASSRLYRDSLAIMANKVRAWLRALEADPGTQPATTHPPRHIAVIGLVKQRLAQLDAGLDFLGHPPQWRPVFSFTYLRDVARGFAQFAAQANRDYIAYVQRAEDQTQNVQQLEQSVILGEASIQIELSRRQEIQTERDATVAAEQLAATRAELARRNADDYARIGWDVHRLDEATAWASAAAVPPDDEMQLAFRGLEDLGISGSYRQRARLLKELAVQRGQRTYAMEVARLRRAAEELEVARRVAAAHTALVRSRLPTAEAAIQTARWRNQFARMNLAQARARETSADLYFDLGRLARETARIYLERAIATAVSMEKAYNFENNTSIKKIRLDYGDLRGASNLMAADLLLRDIDAFLYEHVTSTAHKSQLMVRYLSLRREFPLQFLEFIKTGRMVFQTTLDQCHGDMPGTFNGRIKRVAVDVVGVSSVGGIRGSLSCAGVSSVRAVDGRVIQKVHQAETMVLSPLAPEKSFARLDAPGLLPTGEPAVFENLGLECSWRLEIPLRWNDVQLSTAADVGLVIAYLCQHDGALESADLAALPTRGSSELSLGLRNQGRDTSNAPTLGRLETAGDATFVLPASWLPRNIKDAAIDAVSVVCVRNDGTPVPLTLRLAVDGTPAGPLCRPSADGVTRIERLDTPGPLHGAPVAATYRIIVAPADNPALLPALPGKLLDLSTINDIAVVFAYSHTYR